MWICTNQGPAEGNQADEFDTVKPLLTHILIPHNYLGASVSEYALIRTYLLHYLSCHDLLDPVVDVEMEVTVAPTTSQNYWLSEVHHTYTGNRWKGRISPLEWEEGKRLSK